MVFCFIRHRIERRTRLAQPKLLPPRVVIYSMVNAMVYMEVDISASLAANKPSGQSDSARTKRSLNKAKGIDVPFRSVQKRALVLSSVRLEILGCSGVELHQHQNIRAYRSGNLNKTIEKYIF